MHRLIATMAFMLFTLYAVEPASAFFKRGSETDRLLKKLAKSPSASERAGAAWRLGEIGELKAIPALATALSDHSASVRANAAASLWKYGNDAKSTMPALRKALEDPSFPVIANAAGALKKMGVPFRELEATYRRLLKATRCKERVRGLQQLQGKAEPQELFPVAMGCTRDNDISVANDAHVVIRELVKVKNAEMATLIVGALNDAGNSTTVGLIYAIAAYDPPVTEAVAPLVKILSAPDPKHRSAAADGLGRMRGAALEALPHLAKAVKNDPDEETRASAAAALGAMGTAAAPAIPALMEGARDKWPRVRRESIRALTAMGTLAKDAIPILKSALDDSDILTSSAARTALSRLDPGNAERYRRPARPTPASASGDNLFGDPAKLVAALQEKVPVVLQIIIYPNFATIAAPESTSASGIASYTYRAGAVVGPQRGPRARCKKPFKLADVDFSVLPRVIGEAPTAAGGGTVRYVFLDGGPQCRDLHWTVYVKVPDKPGDQSVAFGLDGKKR